MKTTTATYRLVKACSVFTLIKRFTDEGYTTTEKHYNCPHCAHLIGLRKRVGKPSIKNALIFTKPGAATVAACKCGFRKINKSTKPVKETKPVKNIRPIIDGTCRGFTKNGMRCKCKAAKDSYYCKRHQMQDEKELVF